MQYYRRLPLEGLVNARELGGWPVRGGVTQFGRFIRCEAPRNLTPRDLAFLRDYGVTLSVDFRGDREVTQFPSAFRELPWVEYRRSPTFNASVAFGASRAARRPAMDAKTRWGEQYITMAETAKSWVKSTLEIMGTASGAVIYNCTTGKDRTGIISALLLGLAGVSDSDITADYCVSEIYLKDVYRELLDAYNARWPEESAALTDPFFRTEPENMEKLLDHLHRVYGGAADYLRSCGVADDTMETLRAKLIR